MSWPLHISENLNVGPVLFFFYSAHSLRYVDNSVFPGSFAVIDTPTSKTVILPPVMDHNTTFGTVV